MSSRRSRLVDCNPRWGSDRDGIVRYVTFECPEGHPNCWHTIPFTPAFDGLPRSSDGGAIWERVGDDLATLTLTPSIARQVTQNSETGEIIDPCHMHVNLTNGVFEFAGDSGPIVE
jgi:hypothetical protein